MTDLSTKYWREKFFQSETVRSKCLREKEKLERLVRELLKERDKLHLEIARIKE